jgi:hypothetical protein
MDVRHDYVDPDNRSDRAPLRVEPVRRGEIAAALGLFLWALMLSLIVVHFNHSVLVLWALGVLVGSTGAGLVVAGVGQ